MNTNLIRLIHYRNPITLHRFATLVAAMTVALITAGALVTSTKSGDAIPDWPTSYGSLVPSYLAGGVLIEWTHRLVAGITALLVVTLTVWMAFSQQPRWVKALGGLATFAVLAQAILGGLRVLVVSHEQVQSAALTLTGAPHASAVRIAFAIAHAALAQIVLGLAFAIALLTNPTPLPLRTLAPLQRRFLLPCSLAVVILLFVQLILGAVMRHTEAGLIIPDFPTSFGKLVPFFGGLPFDPNNPQRMSYDEFAFKVAVHFAHRVNALLIALTIVGLFWLVHRYERGNSHLPLRALTAWQLGLVITQIILGAMAIWTQLSVPITVAHVATGATLLGLSVLTFCRVIIVAGGERR